MLCGECGPTIDMNTPEAKERQSDAAMAGVNQPQEDAAG
jgi:hypothetical protein